MGIRETDLIAPAVCTTQICIHITVQSDLSIILGLKLHKMLEKRKSHPKKKQSRRLTHSWSTTTGKEELITLLMAAFHLCCCIFNHSYGSLWPFTGTQASLVSYSCAFPALTTENGHILNPYPNFDAEIWTKWPKCTDLLLASSVSATGRTKPP